MLGRAHAAVPPDGVRYVSMGSSYAAGPGVGLPDPGSGGCQRSWSNFARLVAASNRLDLVDVACSGATTRNILEEGQHGFAPQIEAVTPGTRLVTILIGGNDVAYIPNLLALSCLDGGGTDCGPVVSDAEVDRRFALLPDALRAVIGAVRARAPGAQIVLVGYLPSVPATGAGICAAVPLSLADAARIRSVAERLARVIGGVADAAGVPVVRASLIGTGHDACSIRPFVAGAHPPRHPGWAAPVAYHPDQAGMNAVARALDHILTEPGEMQPDAAHGLDVSR
ncbi:SGNH/GDSL hydrolase family protein [Rhizosaccharibacter radicis]|uniref:SGNH/GDSL hydrolase family protein n=1 Tax=Rhizosaccharibacter radicis TaxID=2782605 RepID=A0ABT1W1G3_9PROT|nr:SGNH/GDSL hydrolase family protein [Acetobacteraceae bacterium KSS12]